LDGPTVGLARPAASPTGHQFVSLTGHQSCRGTDAPPPEPTPSGRPSPSRQQQTVVDAAIEITLLDGTTLRVGRNVGTSALRRVLGVLRGWSRSHRVYWFGWTSVGGVAGAVPPSQSTAAGGPLAQHDRRANRPELANGCQVGGIGYVAGAQPSLWNSPPSNGSTGSTIAACWRRSAMSRQPKQKRGLTNGSTLPQSPRNLTQTASGKPAAVHRSFGTGTDSSPGRCAQPAPKRPTSGTPHTASNWLPVIRNPIPQPDLGRPDRLA
jgi:hypothetical protein